MRNVEIKAKVANLSELLETAKKIAGTEATIIKQHDTFYNIPNGRLKLRRLLNEQTGELIFYDRPDIKGPKLSTFKFVKVDKDSISDMHELFSEALGLKVDVRKVRHLFLVGQTRVHVDEVDGLGSFMELEVCLKDDQSLEEGQGIANELMGKLGIQEKDLISGAYADLLSKS